MSNQALLLDYLFAGELIRTRLREQVPGLAAPDSVQGIETLAQAVEKNITAPTVFVLWEGDLINTGEQGTAAGGRSQLMRQQWTVLLAVRNATQGDRGARNEAAGPYLSAIHKALAGWAPEGTVRPMLRAQGRKATYTANVGLYPLTFDLPLNL
ncbi:MAG: hypothetical protein ABL916_17570 [Burkholderiaceae bacterium]